MTVTLHHFTEAVAFGASHVKLNECSQHILVFISLYNSWPQMCTSVPHFSLKLIIIIIIERKHLGGVMSKDCKDTLQTLKTVTKRECDAK